MRWLKRNLFLVVWILVAAGLMAGAIIFLISRISADAESTDELEKEKQALQSVLAADPSPVDENIATARKEAGRLQSIATNVQARLIAPPVPKLGSQEFASHLLTAISEMQKEGESAGVQMPSPKYAFTFASQRERLVFDAAAIPLLTEQLDEIREISHILFTSKVHQIESLQRVPVSTNDTGAVDFLNRSRTTNGSVVITPYEFIFRGFTVELASVLDKLQRSTRYFVIKSVDVEAMDVKTAPKPVEPTPPPAATTPKPGAAKGGPAAPPKAQIETLLDEKPLRIKLNIEVLKLNQPAKPAK